MKWDKFKSYFVETTAKPDSTISLTPEEEQELASYQVAPEAPPPPPKPDVKPAIGTIDFQLLYDEAKIPNTDEVEALEKFLGGLDDSLPQASKSAAAKAFLGAIGKSPAHVLEDASRKIYVVRAVLEGTLDAAKAKATTHQQEIDTLQKQIDKHRSEIESAHKNYEEVKSQCAIEEARLQGARVFFGHMDKLAEAAPAAPAAPAQEPTAEAKPATEAKPTPATMVAPRPASLPGAPKGKK